jgi:hypothetical protein
LNGNETIYSGNKHYCCSLSYFNELVGGADAGHRYLLGSNLEWGQDVLFLKQWAAAHPEARPLFVEQSSYFDTKVAGIGLQKMPTDLTTPGWYAIGVNKLYDNDDRYQEFRNIEPVAKAGKSIYIWERCKSVSTIVQ